MQFEESDQIVFDDHSYIVKGQAKPKRAIGRITLYKVDYWSFNSIYEGEIVNDQPHGFGRLITSEGECIIGYFVDGKPQGQTVMIDLYHKIVFQGVVCNSPMTFEVSCQPFKMDATRVTNLEPYDDMKDCT